MKYSKKITKYRNKVKSIKKNRKGGGNKILTDMKENCSDLNFFNCKGNCKWEWSGLFGNCKDNIIFDSEHGNMRALFNELMNFNKKQKKLNEEINTIKRLRKEKIKLLKIERIKVLKKLESLSRKNEKIERSLESLNDNNNVYDLTDQQIHIRKEFRNLQLKRDKIESILRMFEKGINNKLNNNYNNNNDNNNDNNNYNDNENNIYFDNN